MKLRNKKRLKWALFSIAIIVFLAMIYYSNLLVKNIQKEEHRKVSVWADAITYKADLVSYMETFFETIRVEESKRATLLAKALQKANEASLHEDMSFVVDVISSNSTIPSIITDSEGNIDWTVNVSNEIADMKNISELGDLKSEYDSLIIAYYKKKYFIVYYKESKIYTNLRLAIDDLVESYFQEVVINDASVPAMVVDGSMKEIIAHGLINEEDIKTPEQRQTLIEHFLTENNPIKIDLPHQGTCYVLYEDSSVLRQLRYFPIIQLIIILIFGLSAYLIFSFSRRSEQNQVWVGMSKETAHQLGTPISSLMAWNELLREQDVDPSILKEIDKDLVRLETIAQRFSKIGSEPELKNENIASTIEEFVEYLQTRLSSKVAIKLNKNGFEKVELPINKYLFEWVIENICKNSVDAMNGKGVIIIDLVDDEKHFYVDIADTGKGIPSKDVNLIFQPGYSSKKRGWGLGLTLAKRIMEQYHKGKLIVKSTIQNRGTIMRIQLKK